jgi:hypothetical protein
MGEILSECKDLVKKYGFSFNEHITTNEILSYGIQTIPFGIGDLLLVNLLIEEQQLKDQYYFINLYTLFQYEIKNTVTNIEFKLKLLSKLKANEKFVFYFDNNFTISLYCSNLLQYNDNYKALHKYFDFSNKMKEKYIIFHTKCRISGDFDYHNLKITLRNFCKKFKCKYKIIILGERIITNNIEVSIHNITTIYEELLCLKENNEILDLSQENIYDNLNFQNYLNDIKLIHNASDNILFGQGGQFCSCYIFANKLSVFNISSQAIPKVKTHCYQDLERHNFLYEINKAYSV